MADPRGRRRRSGGRSAFQTLGSSTLFKRKRHWIRTVILSGFLLILIAGLVGGGVLYTYAGELPSLDRLSAQGLAQSTKIYARDGTTLLDERFEERRTVVPLSAISVNLRHATVSIEDKDFYSHSGVNPFRLVAAGVYDVLHRRAAQGGSTITQQLIKTYLVGSKRDLNRKIREFLLAMELEKHASKDQILEMYLNAIFYGNQAFGIESASQTYFGKPARDLDLAEASFLAGLPQRPSYLNPFQADGLKHARARQRDVLDAMVRDHYATSADADKAYAVDLTPKINAAKAAVGAHGSKLAPHFVDYVWKQLEDRYQDPHLLLRSGLRVVTTLDPSVQALSAKSVQDGVQKFARSNGVNNSAMLAMNPHTGEILAMVGSADFFNPDIGGENNYTTALRQPGSSFKPYTYVTALLNGWSPASILDDANGAKAFPGYRVQDWDGHELGKITLRDSLQKSRNISSVQLFRDVGMDKVFGTARRLGITSKLEPGLSTTLGANELRMTEHLAAYSAFANGGTRVRPMGILEIRDARNQVLEKNDPKPDSGERVLPKGATYIITDILKGAVHPAMNFPVAAKSGTTNDFKDAWYIGYSTDLAVAAWMGRTVTKPQPANESMNYLWGEIGPGYTWHQFMRAYYGNKRPADWARPPDVATVTVCKQTGVPADETATDPTATEMFLKPVPPAKPCGDHDQDSDSNSSSTQRSPSPSPSDGDSPPVIVPCDLLPRPLCPRPSPSPRQSH